MKGVLDKEYALKRQNKRSHVYRLVRRTYEVVDSIKEFHQKIPGTILDIGTADGLMLDALKKAFPNTLCTGIEYSKELIDCNKSKFIQLLQGNAQLLPVKDNVIDVIVATAIIEHLENPEKLVQEAFRVLKKNGIFIITTPHPFWEKVATYIGHLKEEKHHTLLTLNIMKHLLRENGFAVAQSEHFMISPIGMPLELLIEKVLKLWRINFLFLNQKIVGIKLYD